MISRNFVDETTSAIAHVTGELGYGSRRLESSIAPQVGDLPPLR